MANEDQDTGHGTDPAEATDSPGQDSNDPYQAKPEWIDHHEKGERPHGTGADGGSTPRRAVE